MLGNVLNAVNILTLLIITTVQGSRYYYNPIIKEEKTMSKQIESPVKMTWKVSGLTRIQIQSIFTIACMLNT